MPAMAVTMRAQDELDKAVSRFDSIQHLEEVTVLGTRRYMEVIPSQTLTGVRLQQLNSHSVADAIRYFSGIQLKDYGGVGGVKTVDLRSMGSNHMGVFYDGIQLGNAQNGQIDLGKFSLDNIDQISLYNGQKSEIFQPAADYCNAGTIYLRTRRPRFDSGRNDNFNATVRTGSFGLFNPSLRWEHRFSDRVSLTANVEGVLANGKYHFRYRRRFSDGTPAWDTTAVRRNGDVQALRVEAALFGSTALGRLNAKAYYYMSERGIPGAIVNNVWYNSQRQWDRDLMLQGVWQERLSDRYETMVSAKYAHNTMRYLNPDTTLMYIDNRFSQDEVYVSSANKLTLVRDRWDADLSVDYRFNYLDANLTDFSYPYRHSLLAALATAVNLGRFKAQASLLYTLVNDRHSARHNGVVLARLSKWMNKLTPAVFLSYKPFRRVDFNLRAFYKRIFRMPTFNDLYYTDIGNAALRPEYVTQYDLGAQWTRENAEGLLAVIRLSADVYYNHITDKILAVPSGRGQYRWTMMNIGKVRIRGVDASARIALRPARDFTTELGLTYTYQRAQDYTNPDDTGRGGSYKGQIAYIPWHSGSVTLHAGWKERVDLNYSFIYVGERYHNSANIPVNHEQPWYTHDISAGYRFTLRNVRCGVTAEVNNLFNQQYDVINNYPMPGRNYKLILKIDF